MSTSDMDNLSKISTEGLRQGENGSYSISPTHYQAPSTLLHTSATVEHRIGFVHFVCSSELGIEPTDFDDPSCTLVSVYMKRDRDRPAILIPRPRTQRDERLLISVAKQVI